MTRVFLDIPGRPPLEIGVAPGFYAHSLLVLVAIHEQSSDISRGVAPNGKMRNELRAQCKPARKAKRHAVWKIEPSKRGLHE
jgi:hypothetical protein